MDCSKVKIAIVGGGPSGLTALKELRAVGFDVTLFERRHDVGGIWTWTSDRSMTTALQETRVCNSKFGICQWYHWSNAQWRMAMVTFIYIDFATFTSAPELGFYLRSYAKQFDLYKNVELGKTVNRLEKGKGSANWQLTFEDEPDKPRSFDRVVWATGIFLNPRPISFDGQNLFSGRIIHSQDVRNIEDFKDQNIIVLGIGNTAGDIAISAVHHAKSVYLSHRRGAKIFKRNDAAGVPADAMLTASNSSIMWRLEYYFPSLFGKILDATMDGNFKQNWGENKPEWGFVQSPSAADGVHVVVCNDELVPLVKKGRIVSLPGIKRITGPKSVEMDDGSTIDDMDAIVTCTGYSDDVSSLSEVFSFVDFPGGVAPLPNLYMGIFPPEHADTFAHLSYVHLTGPQIPARELMSMSLAQIWAAKSSLPPRPEMDAWIRNHQAWLKKRLAKAHLGYRGEVPSLDWNLFVHKTAGTGFLEHIGWSWKAWKFWWTDRKLYNAVAHGPVTAHSWRIFETGKRDTWDGARQAVLDVDEQMKQIKEAGKKK